MSSRGVSLKRYDQEYLVVPEAGDGYRLMIEAYDAVMMPAAIFIHQKTLINPYDGTNIDEFCAVASTRDLSLYPIGVPNATQSPPFFRKSRVDVVLPSQHIADKVWDAVHAAVCNLVAALNKLDRLKETQDVRCGAALTEESEVSESVSI